MKRKIIIFILGLIGLFGLSSCDTLIYTTPVYYDYYPRATVVIPGRPLPPPPPRYIHRHHQKPHTPPPPSKGNHRGRH